MIKNKTILLISPEPWGQNFVSKHHYANYLAKDNTVYFLNPATGFVKSPLSGMQITIQSTASNLLVIDYLNLLPRLNSIPEKIQRSTYKKQAKKILRAIGKQLDIVWSFDPHRYFDQTIWDSEKTIYHTVDFHPGAKFEAEIIKSSDLFLGVADLILKDHIQIRKGTLISHAADIDGFQNIKAAALPGKNTIKACYVGNFHKHIDYGVLLTLADENKDCDFIMVGPVQDSNLSSGNKIDQDKFEQLSAQKNIFFVGSKPAYELMNIINQCHINLVLFKSDFERIHCSPHKLMGYFYTGNITIANYIDAHKDTDSEIIQMVNNLKDVPAFFDSVKNHLSEFNSTEKQEKRKQFAIANSYDKKIEEIGQYLESTISA